jgi:hypothetical protein
MYQLTAIDWSLRAGVALVFGVFGLEKLAGSSWNPLFGAIGMGHGFGYVTGVMLSRGHRGAGGGVRRGRTGCAEARRGPDYSMPSAFLSAQPQAASLSGTTIPL